MSDDSYKFEYNQKLSILKSIRHEIKKKRFILDESKDKFAFDDLTQLKKVKNTSEVKGYPFVASKVQSKTLKGIKLGLKVIPIETKFEKYEHPTNLEFIALKELTDNILHKNISPHIVCYLGSQNVPNKSRSIKFLNLKRLEIEDKIKTHSNLLISEYIEGGSLDNWVYNIYEKDLEIKDVEWKSIVFQMIYTISVMQYYYKMMHNDFHYGNILVDTSIEKIHGQYFVYTIDNQTYYLPNNGFISKLWDFEYCMVYSNKISEYYPNKFIIGNCEYNKKTHVTTEPIFKTEDSSDDLNVPYNYNEVYDLHYFLTTLLDLYISQELFDWIMEIYPSELIPKEDSNSQTSSDDTNSNTTNSENTNSETTNSETTNSETTNSETTNSENTNSENTNSETTNSDTTSLDNYDYYLGDGRMRNGIDKEFKDLPVPLKVLSHDFFKEFKIKPVDFDETKAIYFNSGF